MITGADATRPAQALEGFRRHYRPLSTPGALGRLRRQLLLPAARGFEADQRDDVRDAGCSSRLTPTRRAATAMRPAARCAAGRRAPGLTRRASACPLSFRKRGHVHVSTRPPAAFGDHAQLRRLHRAGSPMPGTASAAPMPAVLDGRGAWRCSGVSLTGSSPRAAPAGPTWKPGTPPRLRRKDLRFMLPLGQGLVRCQRNAPARRDRREARRRFRAAGAAPATADAATRTGVARAPRRWEIGPGHSGPPRAWSNGGPHRHQSAAVTLNSAPMPMAGESAGVEFKAHGRRWRARLMPELQVQAMNAPGRGGSPPGCACSSGATVQHGQHTDHQQSGPAVPTHEIHVNPRHGRRI